MNLRANIPIYSFHILIGIYRNHVQVCRTHVTCLQRKFGLDLLLNPAESVYCNFSSIFKKLDLKSKNQLDISSMNISFNWDWLSIEYKLSHIDILTLESDVDSGFGISASVMSLRAYFHLVLLDPWGCPLDSLTAWHCKFPATRVLNEPIMHLMQNAIRGTRTR